MASLPTYTIELPALDHSGSSPTSSMSTGDQSSPIMPYFPATAQPTAAPIYGWPLSPSTPLSFQGYSPYSLGLTFNPTTPTFNPYAYNYFPTAVPTRMPSSSSVPTANCANPMDVFGAAPPRPDFERFNPNVQANAMNASVGFVSPCSTPETPDTIKNKASGSHLFLKRGRTPTPENGADHSPDHIIAVDLPAIDESSPEVAPRKRSRTAQACERCRVRKARCFGGNPCNRCIKRKFDCEFTPTRQRGSNKPRSPDLPIQNLNLHAHPQSIEHHHMHAQPHHGVIAQRPVALARAHTHGHAHASRPRVRRHSMPMQALNPTAASSMMGVIPSVFRPMPVHTTTLPPPQTPVLGLGLQLNPAIDEDADGESDPDFGNAASAPLSTSNSNLGNFSGFGMGSTITIPSPNYSIPPMTNQYFSNMNGELDLYTPLMEDETMFMFSPQGISGNSDDADGSYDFPFTPVTPTIPLPMPALGSQPSSQAGSPLENPGMTTSSQSGLVDMSSSSGSLPSGGMDLDNPMLSMQAEHLVGVRDEAMRHLYTSGAGDWLASQPRPTPSPTF